MPVPAFTDQIGVWLRAVRKHMFPEIMPGKGSLSWASRQSCCSRAMQLAHVRGYVAGK